MRIPSNNKKTTPKPVLLLREQEAGIGLLFNNHFVKGLPGSICQ